MDDFKSVMSQEFNKLNQSERKIISEVWEHKTDFIKWPVRAELLWEACKRVGVKFHVYPDAVKQKVESKGIRIDTRSNGPAIVSFLCAGGERPNRMSSNQGWSIHHIYDGKFLWAVWFTPSPAPKKTVPSEIIDDLSRLVTLDAVKDGKHFTQSAGLVAIHPIAEALADEYFYFAWLLRHEAFLKFNYDPDAVFSTEIDEYGFKKGF